MEKTHDSAQYDTAQNLTLRSMILRGTSEKLEYLGKNKTKNENVLTHWSVAQAGSNYEKTGGRKSRWTVLLSIPQYGEVIFERKTLLPVQKYDSHSGPLNLVPLLEGNFSFYLLLPYL